MCLHHAPGTAPCLQTELPRSAAAHEKPLGVSGPGAPGEAGNPPAAARGNGRTQKPANICSAPDKGADFSLLSLQLAELHGGSKASQHPRERVLLGPPARAATRRPQGLPEAKPPTSPPQYKVEQGCGWAGLAAGDNGGNVEAKRDRAQHPLSAGITIIKGQIPRTKSGSE